MSAAGLVPVLRLGEEAGLRAALVECLTVASPNAAAKAAGVIGGMVAGADTIEGLDLVRRRHRLPRCDL